jgi:hypothetical protein
MNFYPENCDVTLTASFKDVSGTAGTPESVSARLLDMADIQIEALGAISITSPDTDVEITISSAHNSIPEGVVRIYCVLEVTAQYESGPVVQRLPYGLRRAITLKLMDNSFMNYEYADMMSQDFANLSGWLSASEELRRVALQESYQRITQIPMKYAVLNELGVPNERNEVVILRKTWIDATQDDFASWPPHFQRVLRRAQMVETNELLQGDVIARKRRAGIVAESIGESSIQISGSTVDYGVSSDTLRALVGYVHFRMTIGRG